MNSGSIILAVVLSLVASGMTLGLTKLLEHLRRRDAESEARRIIAQTRQELENRRREFDWVRRDRNPEGGGRTGLASRRTPRAQRDLTNAGRPRTTIEHLRKQENRRGDAAQLTEKIRTPRSAPGTGKLLDHRQTLHELSGLKLRKRPAALAILRALQQEAGAVILRHEKQLAEACEERSREVMLTSLQRYAAAHTAETTTSTVDIPNDEMKGRIIGREGRNIRAFEKATGVDVIIDDTPGVVIVSAFDMIRREIARLALNRLIADGRIHPSNQNRQRH